MYINRSVKVCALSDFYLFFVDAPNKSNSCAYWNSGMKNRLRMPSNVRGMSAQNLFYHSMSFLRIFGWCGFGLQTVPYSLAYLLEPTCMTRSSSTSFISARFLKLLCQLAVESSSLSLTRSCSSLSIRLLKQQHIVMLTLRTSSISSSSASSCTVLAIDSSSVEYFSASRLYRSRSFLIYRFILLSYVFYYSTVSVNQQMQMKSYRMILLSRMSFDYHSMSDRRLSESTTSLPPITSISSSVVM